MVEKLRLVLQSPRLRLVLKSAIFGGFLFLVKLGGFGFFSILFFLGVAAFLYFRAEAHFLKSQNLYSFAVLLIIALGGLYTVHRPEFWIAEVFFFSFIFYLLLGIKELVFVHRYQSYSIKNILLFYAVFALFFLSDKSSLFFLKYILVFAATLSLYREWFFWSEHYFPRRHLLTTLLLSLVTMEILWATALLPIGFISAANLVILMVYILTDFVFGHFQGIINKRMILKNSIIFIVTLLLILGTSTWSAG
ncbi:MAG: hypothetical protein PHN74_01590 [Candidatus Pacebacteria bacterium]|nr:hypothetical protein [Candidatus Paceibacterota bacterium]